MPRRSNIRYFQSRRAYYTQLNRKQVKLAAGPDDYPHGPTYQRALKRFSELLQVSAAPGADQDNTVRVLVDLYAQRLEKAGQAKTLTLVLATCTSAVKEFGDLPVGKLTPHHVQKWLDEQSTWGPTYRRMALRTFRTALNSAARLKLISGHDILPHSVQVRGAKRSRGKEAFVPAEMWGRVISAVDRHNTNFGDLLRVIYATGCRPGEAYHFEARYYDAAARAMVYPGDPARDEYCWKMARKTGKPRRIYVPDELVTMVEERMRRSPTGPIFTSAKRRRWSDPAVSCNLRMYCDRLGIDPAVTAYGLRHTFATRWLLGSGSIKVLADLMGTSVSMLEKHYAHLDADPDRLRSIYARVMGGGSLPEEPQPRGTVGG